MRHVDRDIADDLDSLLVGIFFYCRPLAGEKELVEGVLLNDPASVGIPEGGDRLWLPVAQCFRPFYPWPQIMGLLHRHEEGKIRQPVGVLMLIASNSAASLPIFYVHGKALAAMHSSRGSEHHSPPSLMGNRGGRSSPFW